MIKEKLKMLEGRVKIEKMSKYKELQEKSYIASTKKEKIYDYYLCDFCGKEIKLGNKWEEKCGGVVIFPASLTKKSAIKLVLHNNCLKLALEEFEKEINSNDDETIEENINHIPDIGGNL